MKNKHCFSQDHFQIDFYILYIWLNSLSDITWTIFVTNTLNCKKQVIFSIVNK